MKKQTVFPKGWNERKIQRVIKHYEGQSEEEAVAEDEAAYRGRKRIMMEIPIKAASEVRRLLAKLA
ncbi:MAG: hypothetical protein NTX50_06120 [Candidatus Sumerlaeota bacterium]|nr:hypothetical protein [Candidatus Sumerlaeota bacterium]